MNELLLLIEQCSPLVQPQLMMSLIKTESNFKRFAIGMDANSGWVHQPKNIKEAKETVKKLKSEKRSFSLGYAQIHVSNIERFGLTFEQAFDPCVNIHTSELILKEYYTKSLASGYNGYLAMFATLRGYNSGYINREISNHYAVNVLRGANLKVYSLSSIGKKTYSSNSLKNQGYLPTTATDYFKLKKNKDFFDNNHSLDVFK